MRAVERESGGSAEQAVEQPLQLEEPDRTKFTAHGAVPGVAADGGAERPSASQLVYKDDGMSQLAGGVSKFLGGSFFSGPSAQLSSSMLPRAPARPREQTDAGNRGFETGHLENALGAGTLKPVDYAEGKTFTAQGCWTGIGEVSFTFDRAAVGTFIDHNHECAGALIQMSVATKNCGSPKHVRLVQVCREFRVDEVSQERRGIRPDVIDRNDPSNPDNDRLRRSGYHHDKASNDWVANKDAKSLDWRVDQNVANGSPWFPGSGEEDRHGGRNGTADRPAIQRDAPATFSEKAQNIGKEFRTCAVAYDDQGHGVVLASIDWGYYCDVHGNVSFDMPVAYEGAKVEVYDASDRWNKLPGNDKTGVERPDTR